MRLIIEEIDGVIYGDIIITDVEASGLLNGAVLDSAALLGTKRYYIGLRVGEKWRYTDPKNLFDEIETE